MIKFKIDDGENAVESECELLAVGGLTRPCTIVYQFRTDFAADNAEAFACLVHLSAQLQAAARDAMQEAIKIAKAEGTDLDDDFMQSYEAAVYGIEKKINRTTGPEHGNEVADDDADD